MKYVALTNWSKYQHYSHRNPPWIKYHCEFVNKTLTWPDDARLLALLLMPVAAQRDNVIPAEAGWLSVETGIDKQKIGRALSFLRSAGFIADASEVASTDGADDGADASESASESASSPSLYISESSVSASSEVGVSKKKKTKTFAEVAQSEKEKAQRNGIWDALTAAFGFDATTPPMRSLKGKVVNGLVDAGATPDEVAVRARRYREQHPTWEFTMPSLLKWWDSLAPVPVERPAWFSTVQRSELLPLLDEFVDVLGEPPSWWTDVDGDDPSNPYYPLSWVRQQLDIRRDRRAA